MKFSQKEDQYLRDNYLTIPAKRMAKNLGRSEGSARQRMKILGIVVPKEVVEYFKKASQFPPGSISHNKGQKMSSEVYSKVKSTMFKKGQQPINTKADGDIVTRKNTNAWGKKTYYKWIRISKANWKMLHVVLWENKHGPIPKGMIIVFKDKNSLNVTLENLELITRSENMKRNTIHNLPPELKQTVKVLSSFKRKIKKHEK